MTGFIKKYWLNLAIGMILLVLIFYIIPAQEKSYLEAESSAIRKKANWILIWTEGVLFSIFIILALRGLKSSKEFFWLLLNLLLLALPFFFLFTSVFLSAAYFLNKLSGKETVEKVYRVSYVDNKEKYLRLWDNDSKESGRADQLLTENANGQLKPGDTVVVSFKKGLLGFNFDPRIKRK